MVCAYGISVGNGGNHQLGCAFLPGQTVGSLDTSTRGPGTVNLHGWAIDPDTANSLPIHVYVDGVGTAIADRERRPPGRRPARLPGYGNAHGFDITVPVIGNRTVCVYAISTRGKPNVTLGCTRTSGTPVGALDRAGRPNGGDAVRRRGWALDPDSAAPIAVHVYVDGVGRAIGTANTNRPDVGNVYPGWGNAHGYDITVPVTPGLHQVCTYGISVGGGGERPARVQEAWSSARRGTRARGRSATGGEGALHPPSRLAHDRADVASAHEPRYREHIGRDPRPRPH